jgi:hypothetical protein
MLPPVLAHLSPLGDASESTSASPPRLGKTGLELLDELHAERSLRQ